MPSRSRISFSYALLVAFLAAQLLPWISLRDLRGGPVRAAAIGTGAALETCPHHPEGCPKDCMCPKLKADPDSAFEGAVRQPFLARCTDKAKAPGAEALGGGLPAEPARFVLLPRARPVLAPRIAAPADRFADPIEKVPIA